MAKKKAGGTTESKAGTKRAGVKKSKGGAAVASETGAKSATPKAKKSAVPKAAAASAKAEGGAKKAAAEIKLNDRQREFLKKVKDAGEPGYRIGQKIEQRTIDALVDRKLLKKGPKHKESGGFHYLLTKAGEKHLGTPSPATSQSTQP